MDYSSLWEKTGPIVVTCPRGTPFYLAGELNSLGFPIIDKGDTYVQTTGSFTDTMVMNLQLRTAHRVLFLLGNFTAVAPGELYARIYELPWETWMNPDGYLTVTSTAATLAVRDSRFVNVKAKDAIVDRLRDRTGIRPSSGPTRMGLVVHILWQGEAVRLFLDTSGEPLSRRGYRRIPLDAPMQETLAAAVIKATGWTAAKPLLIPMCGSGTIAIEAALMALDRPPGLLRNWFGFMAVRGYDSRSFHKILRIARSRIKERLCAPIIATDIRREAVAAARRNARAAQVDGFIDFRCCPFEDTPIPPGGGAVILNPYYGHRRGEKGELRRLYGQIGDFLKKKCAGYQGFIFTGNLESAKWVGLRTSRRLTFYNGDIPCRLLCYDLYEGTNRLQKYENTRDNRCSDCTDNGEDT